MNQVSAYLITCLTNMHVGAGGTNYDVIDNIVQRDVITEVPTIHSSSLKGALREFFKNKWGENDGKLNYIFGPDGNRNGGKDDGGIGNFKFFAGDLLSLPVRATNKAYYNATSPFLIERVNLLAKNLGLGKDILPSVSIEQEKSPQIANGGEFLEDWKANSGLQLKDTRIGNDIALFSEKDFKRLAKKLPVIARNKVHVDKNLFYEEVVPRETRFVFFVVKNDDEKGKAFDELLENNVVQIGANGSIGYGFCKISKIS